MPLPHSLRTFRHRDFRLYFVGQGVSQTGTWLQMIATSWLIYHLSGSAFLLGLASFMLYIPILVLGPFAGVWVDRHRKRQVLIVTQNVAFAQSLAMLALVASGQVQVWHLIAANLVLGIVNAIDSPARQSQLVELVGGKEDLPNAVAFSSMLMNGARFIGPMIGGAVIAAFGEVWGFGLNSIMRVAVIAALLLIRAAAGGKDRRALARAACRRFPLCLRLPAHAQRAAAHIRGEFRGAALPVARALLRPRRVPRQLADARLPDRRRRLWRGLGDDLPRHEALGARAAEHDSVHCGNRGRRPDRIFLREFALACAADAVPGRHGRDAERRLHQHRDADHRGRPHARPRGFHLHDVLPRRGPPGRPERRDAGRAHGPAGDACPGRRIRAPRRLHVLDESWENPRCDPADLPETGYRSA